MNHDIHIVDENGETISNTANDPGRTPQCRCHKCGRRISLKKYDELGGLCMLCWIRE